MLNFLVGLGMLFLGLICLPLLPLLFPFIIFILFVWLVWELGKAIRGK